ncbi:hypothetical protein MASR2M15_19850 [Anaerolineales bacterium]
MKRLFLSLLCLMAMGLQTLAQETEPEEAKISYYRGEFNVPLIEGWEQTVSEDGILSFKDPQSASVIQVQQWDVDMVEAALASLNDTAIYSDKINMPDGTWQQVIAVEGNESTSAIAQDRKGRIFSIRLTESLAEVDVQMLIVPLSSIKEVTNPEEASEIDGIRAALERLGINESPESLELEERIIRGREWTIARFEIEDEPVSVYAYLFGNAIYTSTIVGETPTNIDTLVDAYYETYLGFFTTPENEAYLILGLAVSGILLFGFLLSLWWRNRNANQDLEVLASIASK